MNECVSECEAIKAGQVCIENIEAIEGYCFECRTI
jgi:hypothetical protein